MRKSEALAATIVDDRGADFRIRGTKSETSDRSIPVNGPLRAVLDRLKSRRVFEARVVVMKDIESTKLLRTNDIAKAVKRACTRLDLPPIRIHDFRHFFASAGLASGVDVPTVSRWLGHADGGALAMETYGHLLKDHSMASAKKLDFTGDGNGALGIPA
jgi:integrase